MKLAKESLYQQNLKINGDNARRQEANFKLAQFEDVARNIMVCHVLITLVLACCFSKFCQ